MTDVFLSYSSQDKDKSGLIAEALTEQGFSVWWDRKIPHGRRYRRVIQEALDQAKCVLVLWSSSSVQSDWVVEEAEEGLRRCILVPALIEDDVEVPLGFRNIEAAQLVTWVGSPTDPEFRLLSQALEDTIRRRTKDEEDSDAAKKVGVTAARRTVLVSSSDTTNPVPGARVQVLAGSTVITVIVQWILALLSADTVLSLAENSEIHWVFYAATGVIAVPLAMVYLSHQFEFRSGLQHALLVFFVGLATVVFRAYHEGIPSLFPSWVNTLFCLSMSGVVTWHGTRTLIRALSLLDSTGTAGNTMKDPRPPSDAES